jgi:transcriptional regulator with XRE-family HTH domain/tetratricopeptide (TPR) repeat protein
VDTLAADQPDRLAGSGIEQLRQALTDRGWTGQDLVDHLQKWAYDHDEGTLGLTRSYVSEWLNGKRGISRPYARRISAVVGIPANYFVDRRAIGSARSSSPPGFGSQARRDLEEIIRLTRHHLTEPKSRLGLTATAGDPLERLTHALRHPGRVDQHAVAHLERVTVALEQLEPMVDSRSIVGLVSGHIATISELLEGSLNEGIRRQLCSIAAETTGLAGWLRFVADDSSGAQAYWRIAQRAAHEAEDQPLGAYLMGRAACKPFYREDAHSRLARLDGSFGQYATLPTQAWLATLKAEAHALIGEADVCQRALDTAQTELARARDGEPIRPRVRFFDQVWLDGAKGVTLAKLGEHEEAQSALRNALEQLDPCWQKHRAWLLAILASTYVAEGRPEEACQVMGQSLAIVAALQTEADLGQLIALRGDLEPWARTTAVQEFDEKVHLMAPSRAFL